MQQFNVNIKQYCEVANTQLDQVVCPDPPPPLPLLLPILPKLGLWLGLDLAKLPRLKLSDWPGLELLWPPPMTKWPEVDPN